MRGLPFDINKGARPTCYRCLRAMSQCLCHLAPPFQAHCNILILQHTNELKKYNGTARMVTSAITNSRLMRGIAFSQDKVKKHLANQKSYLLFPGATASDCSDVVLDENSTVIVVDGTWSEAGKVLKFNPFLKELPYLTFSQPLKSNFLTRRQPKDHYLSTIESVGHLLKINAIAHGLDRYCEKYEKLFVMFDEMVEKQLSFFPRRQGVILGGKV